MNIKRLFLFCLVIPLTLKAQDINKPVVIPLGGNAWVHGGNANITNMGVEDWADAASIITVYFKAEFKGNVKVAIRLKVPDGNSIIQTSINGKSITREVKNHDFDTVSFGNFAIDTGYVKVTITGIKKSGGFYADISDVVLTGIPSSAVFFVKNNEGNFFHWGRRGASVHLKYVVPAEAKTQTEWFYGDVNVPAGMDKTGSYFQVCGFSVGYFGMQVNSATERRILFSVWSPQNTDDPKSIAENMRIALFRKGENVTTGEFGNEGSGGQSYLKYTWQAGKTYSFLLHASPDFATNITTFTAYFKEKSEQNWKLIASFRRPQTAIFLTGLYSFVENFIPENGDQQRLARFGNQWVYTNQGKWYALNKANLTSDNTARQKYRLDYGGGTTGSYFYLRNGGFFNETHNEVPELTREQSEGHPDIDFKQLP